MKETKKWYRMLAILILLALGALALGFCFPLTVPFLVGFLAARVAEPATGFLCRKLRLPRAAGAAISITAVYGLILALVWGLVQMALGEIEVLTGKLPELVERLEHTAQGMEDALLTRTAQMPERIRPGLEKGIRGIFSDGSQVTQRLSGSILTLASRLLGKLPDVFVFLGTAITSSFLISVRLPALEKRLKEGIPGELYEKIRRTGSNLRANLGAWFRAEVKIMGFMFLLLSGGFLILRIPHGILLGAGTALVDALPVLGTGTVLVPWGVVSLLRGDSSLGVGLLVLYALAALMRWILEPRLLGRQLGLNPLITLGAVYAGYRLWGVAGMILAPVVSVTVLDLWRMGREPTL